MFTKVTFRVVIISFLEGFLKVVGVQRLPWWLASKHVGLARQRVQPVAAQTGLGHVLANGRRAGRAAGSARRATSA
jgi:hypothetical protein